MANHPFGVVDGLVLCDLAVKARGNFRILINAMLCRDRDLAPYFLPIDFHETKAAVKNNIRSKKMAQEALEQDIPLLVFPSGFVSTALTPTCKNTGTFLGNDNCAGDVDRLQSLLSIVRPGIKIWYPTFTTWDPISGTTPMSPVAPCTQVGWGVVNLSNIDPIIKHLNGTEEMDNRPSDVVLCMDVNQQMREAYWDAYPTTVVETKSYVPYAAIFREE